MADQTDPDTINSPLIDIAQSAAAGIADHLGQDVDMIAETSLAGELIDLRLETPSALIVIHPRKIVR